ncbi:DUF1642 domain-containing protein [Streptococcus australis]|uniref:DUF1642 domain-containing protein n=1 Tax=Streptococcus australis TaxID=113107 RepID=UPI001CC1992A|nr:DUF1642 domain-containing protein [Streptococcus australis]MBZ2154888.1 DUF1642 domain-containing protein [Streptococcus australis]
MNKQELTKRIEGLRNLFGNESKYIEIDMVIRLISELEEPQKVQVPQFVADWIEVCKENSAIGLYNAMNPDFLKQWNKSDELISWFKKTRNQITFAHAWLDGFEVEKEKRYYVRLKGVDENYNYLNRINHLDAWCLAEIKKDKKFRTTHTRKELEDANFGWVFDCPGMEVEEVEDE